MFDYKGKNGRFAYTRFTETTDYFNAMFHFGGEVISALGNVDCSKTKTGCHCVMRGYNNSVGIKLTSYHVESTFDKTTIGYASLAAICFSGWISIYRSDLINLVLNVPISSAGLSTVRFNRDSGLEEIKSKYVQEMEYTSIMTEGSVHEVTKIEPYAYVLTAFSVSISILMLFLYGLRKLDSPPYIQEWHNYSEVRQICYLTALKTLKNTISVWIMENLRSTYF